VLLKKYFEWVGEYILTSTPIIKEHVCVLLKIYCALVEDAKAIYYKKVIYHLLLVMQRMTNDQNARQK